MQSKDFIQALTGSPDTILNWRVINDREKGDLAKNFRGSFDQVLPILTQYNQNYWGIFFSVNEMDGVGNELANVQFIRSHVADLDNTFASNAMLEKAIASELPPHLMVRTSENKFHIYWLTQPYQGNEFYTCQQRKFNNLYDADKSIIDATRVMRMPGFYHCKGEPFLIESFLLHTGAKYTFEQIESHLKDVIVYENISQRLNLGEKDKSAPSLEWLIFALNLRDPNELDRNEWLLTTSAFKQSGWSFTDEQTLLDLWQKWCAKYKNNNVAENIKLWNSIKDSATGWSHFKRVTLVDAYINNQGSTEPKPAGDEEFGEILDTESKKKWFKDCYFVEAYGEIFTKSGRFMNANKFNGAYGGKQFCMSVSGSKVVNEAWQAALRATDWNIPKVDHVRFLPEEKSFAVVKDSLGRKGLNTYIPARIASQEGDVSLWLTHLNKMFATESDIHIFCSYIAHCVKYPGYKIPWAVMFQSLEGAGKTVFAQVLKHALGEMYTYQPKASELAASGSKFNAWMRSKLAIIVDEIWIEERRELVEILKPMITDARVEIQSKGVDQEMEDNCANWLFFSNYKNAIPINQNGRRYCIFFSPLQTKRQLIEAGMNDEYFYKLRYWLFNEGGLEKITYWLMNYPVQKGSLPGRAPETSSYAEALKIGRSPLEVLLDDKIAAREYGFRNGFVSYTMFLKAIEASKYKRPADYNIKSIIESRGYSEIGEYTHTLGNEDFMKPPLLFALNPLQDVKQYEKSQQE